MEFTINQIAGMLSGEVRGNGDDKISMLAKIQDAKKGQISFLSNPKYEQYIYTTNASAVIVSKDFVARKEIGATLILVDDPYISFTRLLEEYHKMISFQKSGVEQPSFVATDARIGKGIYRGAFSYIGSNTIIGDNVKLYPQVYVGDNVVIGNDTILHAGVKIYSGTRIGSNCVIHAGTVIGSDGFGFAPQEDGSYKTIPQLGSVIIEDNVAIGGNTVIDCATLFGDATTIRKGVKLDNLIQIAHNVEIGQNTVIAAQSGISGSSKIGENCLIAGQVGVAGHLTIANNTGLGAQSGISKSIKEAGHRYMGSPHIEFSDYFKAYAVFKKLPDINHRLHDLEIKLQKIQNNSLPVD
ncbi:MAG: UDP-3-O-(3-hydroxymyristoyl)glucosamine N-acyltransferase [Chryseolinea sp.]